jgi:hypothetical protein
MALRFVEIDGEQLVEHDGPLESWWLDTRLGVGGLPRETLESSLALPFSFA